MRLFAVSLALLFLGVFSPADVSAQTQVINTARIAPPAAVTNTNPSVSCTSGICQASDTDTVAPSANLSITKTTTTVAGTVGSTMSYVIVVANTGPSNAINITVTDALPAGTLSFYAISGVGGSGFSFTTSTSAITATLGTLTFGATATITLVVNIVAAPGSGVITNTAVVTSTVADPVPANNSSTATLTSVLSADLSISKTASTAVGTVGSTFSYAISFSNGGPSAAANLTLTDAITSGLTLIGATTSVGSLQTSTNFLTVTLASLASGAGGSITLTVQVSQVGGSITNAIQITSTTADPVPANNTGTSTISRAIVTDLSLSKVAGSTTVSSAATLTFSLVISNAGPSTATTATFVDTLPAGFGTITNIQSAVSAGGQVQAVTASASIIAGSVTLAAGQSATITFQVTAPTAGGSYTNTATVSPATGAIDPNNANNTGTATVAVNAQADLSISKTASTAVGTVGSTFS
ncbi:MAG: hypothetical protein ACKVIH_11150, partial [Burkholderiales bacterium]